MEWIWIIPEESGERIDALLPRYVEGLSRARAQKLLEQGAVTLGETEIMKKKPPRHRRGALSPAPAGSGERRAPAPGHSPGRSV